MFSRGLICHDNINLSCVRHGERFYSSPRPRWRVASKEETRARANTCNQFDSNDMTSERRMNHKGRVVCVAMASHPTSKFNSEHPGWKEFQSILENCVNSNSRMWTKFHGSCDPLPLTFAFRFNGYKENQQWSSLYSEIILRDVCHLICFTSSERKASASHIMLGWNEKILRKSCLNVVERAREEKLTFRNSFN